VVVAQVRALPDFLQLLSSAKSHAIRHYTDTILSDPIRFDEPLLKYPPILITLFSRRDFSPLDLFCAAVFAF